MNPELEEFLKTVDKSSFSDPAFSEQRTEKPWGWELLWTPEDLPYVGKILHIKAGAQLSLQVHDQKQETWRLLQGQAKAVRENAQGELTEMLMQPGLSYTNKIGQTHTLKAITDTDILEVSTPEKGNTYRLNDPYGRQSVETEELRNQPNRGWRG